MRRIVQYGLLAAMGVFCLEAQGAGQQIEVTIPGIAEPGILSAEEIGAEIEVIEFNQPDGSISKLPGAVDPGQVVLTRVFEGSPDYIDWIRQVSDEAALAGGIIHRDIACRQRIGAGTGLHIVYFDAFPVAYDGPDFAPDTTAFERLTCVYAGMFMLVAPDPFRITRVVLDSGDLILQWAGVLGDGQILFADSPQTPAGQWAAVTPSVLSQKADSGQARIPLSAFSGNRYFLRVEKP